MLVKIGNVVYRDEKEPVGVFLTAQDRLNIIAMSPKVNFYCSFPKGTSEEVVKEFMVMPAPAPALVPAPEEGK